MKTSYKLTIKGTVQGVGFRPFIYGLAKRYNLKGTVSNSSNGVEIFINSSKEILDKFLLDIKENHPPLSKIESIRVDKVEFREFKDFKIIETKREGDIFANIPPDISICSECERELFDPQNRRYLYPFITCTNCGVRYSIIYDLPYDRVNTSMKFFKMCEACDREYKNPLDRRYHAEPIGCWDCGATLILLDREKEIDIDGKRVIEKSIELLKEGNILAIKGVGGYHLVCDATNKESIKKLRERKRRPTKPFAIMVRDLEMAKELAYIDKKEEHEDLVRELVSKTPFQLSSVCSQLLKLGIKITKKSLKRFLKSLGYSYKRARAKITKCNKEAFREAKKYIEILKKEVSKDKNKNLYFFDESFFSLKPNIPYGWSPKKESIEIESSRSTSLKVLGFFSLDNRLKAYTTYSSINSDMVIRIFNDFLDNLPKDQKATIILDNASTHTSNKFKSKIKYWKKRGLTLYYLPPYSPELNRIEILWKFMKYHWIEIKDYASTTTLEDYINRVLSSHGVGKNYEISFR